jgi:hypothetical protein
MIFLFLIIIVNKMGECSTLGGAPRRGKACGNKYPVGLIVFDSNPGGLDVDSAKSLAYWEALIKLDPPSGCYVIYKFDNSEPGDPEKTTEELNVTGVNETGRTPETDVYQVLMGICNLKSIYGSYKTGKDQYVLRIMNDGTIEGSKPSAGTIGPVLARVSGNYITGKPGTIGKVVLSVTQIEDYKDNVAYLTPDFTSEQLNAVTVNSIEFDKVTTNTATSVVVDVVDCDGSEVDDLTIGADGVHMFTAYDRTAGADLTIDPVAQVGNRYTLTFGAGVRVSTNIIEIGYKQPSDTDQLYRNYNKLILTNP